MRVCDKPALAGKQPAGQLKQLPCFTFFWQQNNQPRFDGTSAVQEAAGRPPKAVPCYAAFTAVTTNLELSRRVQVGDKPALMDAETAGLLKQLVLICSFGPY